jgi:hypothetical protein
MDLAGRGLSLLSVRAVPNPPQTSKAELFEHVLQKKKIIIENYLPLPGTSPSTVSLLTLSGRCEEL